ncbi:hypothetical protein ACTXT7_009314 [Hymenolepis weldensis]
MDRSRAKILSHFTTLDAKALARVPKAQYLQRLWLQFITNLTFTREGQALLLNFPGTISVLVDHVQYCRDPENRHAAYLCLQNLCANTSFKTYLYQRTKSKMCYFAENRVNGHREHQSYAILPFIPYSMQHLYQLYVDLNSIEIGRYYTYDDMTSILKPLSFR